MTQFVIETVNDELYIQIDGKEATHFVEAVSVQMAKGMPTIVTVQQVSDEVSIKGEGIVTITPGEIAANAIERLNLADIDKEALTRLEWGGDATLTGTVIQVILERLRA